MPDLASRVLRRSTTAVESVALDVGAHDGRTVMRLQQVLPSPRIHAFEPVRSHLRHPCRAGMDDQCHGPDEGDPEGPAVLSYCDAVFVRTTR